MLLKVFFVFSNNPSRSTPQHSKISKWVSYVNTFIQFYLESFFFNIFKDRLTKFKVLSPLETIELLERDDKLSLVRYGDGEFDIIANKKGPNYQKASPALREALLKILNSPKICVAIPEALSIYPLTSEQNLKTHLRFWRTYVVLKARLLNRILDRTRTYGDACVSRPYTHHQNDVVASQVFKQIRKLWANKNVIVIEGEFTRFGVGNDLLNEAASVKRIIGPAKNPKLSFAKVSGRA